MTLYHIICIIICSVTFCYIMYINMYHMFKSFPHLFSTSSLGWFYQPNHASGVGLAVTARARGAQLLSTRIQTVGISCSKIKDTVHLFFEKGLSKFQIFVKSFHIIHPIWYHIACNEANTNKGSQPSPGFMTCNSQGNEATCRSWQSEPAVSSADAGVCWNIMEHKLLNNR